MTEAPINLNAASPHTLQCMEIWGGSEAIDNTIEVPGIDGWVVSTPFHGAARGGDIHYVSMCACGRISRFALADVSGHGDEAASLADRLRSLMRRYINTPDQTDLVRALNSEMSAIASGGSFATAVMAAYSPPTDHLIVCNAGHPVPLWYHANSGKWDLLKADNPQIEPRIRNIPLGIIDKTDYVQFAVKLEKDDLVLMYSDAITEALSVSEQMLGVERLLALLRELDASDPAHLLGRLVDALSRYRGGADPDDDQTLLLLRHNASDPPRLTLGKRLRAVARMIGLTRT